MTAQEVEGLSEKMQALARQAERTIDLDGLIALMWRAAGTRRTGTVRAPPRNGARRGRAGPGVLLLLPRHLELLEALGARLVPFSPLADAALPACDGLYLGGGYPELHVEALSGNASMRASVRAAVQGGLPTIAECGGFMYLTEAIDGWPMAGALPTCCHKTDGLVRFGYAELTAGRDSLLFRAGDAVRGHEFHQWDAEDPGDSFAAQNPSGKGWRCAYASDTLLRGLSAPVFCQQSRRRGAICSQVSWSGARATAAEPQGFRCRRFDLRRGKRRWRCSAGDLTCGAGKGVGVWCLRRKHDGQTGCYLVLIREENPE